MTLEERVADAISKAITVTETMASMDVEVLVIGSLAEGRFQEQSDLDFLVRHCPQHLIYAIEGKIEDIVHPFKFDVVYENEIPAHRLDRFTRHAIDARELAKRDHSTLGR
ncbi:nucleotidyltransferase domain-containing protein [Rhizobium leguminosarum]|uniref:nucleotidyltransferase domain-containing protein n=1 Tax=Rhizobium leguminosarum TaxID=384 RepID=UPI0010313949|nr:nucleotidyltransferase domain-containing protein [Rhizobium leguminosarum]TBH28184.1 nucleotidyltransferase domain-containing protein [Rhizobium leguminosarum]